MQAVGIETYHDYLDYLEVHPEEFTQLFNTILINVTTFFRDEAAWDYINTEIIPKIRADKQSDQPIRIWSAGCASGEEAYTLALLLAEHLGLEQFTERVKIYATDVDDEALNQARQASYTAQQIENIPPELVNKYFEQINGRHILLKELRRFVIFGRHDLIHDAPISRLDLLICRNTLMYLNAETQARILMRFHFALKDDGYLFLGKAETFLSYSSYFAPDNLKQRLFQKVSRDSNRRGRMLSTAHQGHQRIAADHEAFNHIHLRTVASDANPVAQLVVGTDGQLVQANQQARNLFSLSQRDLGRSFHDLEVSYRPVELRSCIEQAYTGRSPVKLKEVFWLNSATGGIFLDVQITLLADLGGNKLGISIVFDDVTRYRQLQDELQRTNQELETTLEELQSTNEELETTNEELQSTNEELETTNEELQSSNEELETMNEELQSINQEFQTINEELQQRSDAYNRVNAFLESILTGLRRGVVVVDKDMEIQMWNEYAEDLWGLNGDEVKGRSFLNLDIGLPVEELRPALRGCIAGESEIADIVLLAINRRGKNIAVKVTCTPLADSKQGIHGAIMLMEEENPPTTKTVSER